MVEICERMLRFKQDLLNCRNCHVPAENCRYINGDVLWTVIVSENKINFNYVISWAMRKLGVEEWLVSAVMSMYTGARKIVGRLSVTSRKFSYIASSP